MGIAEGLLLLVALLTHNLANSFPQSNDAVGWQAPVAGIQCPEPTSAQCSCVIVDDFEMYCPSTSPIITVKIDPGKYAQIYCNQQYNISEMPTLDLGNTTQVKIKYCPLPQDKPIRDYIDFLGVKHVKDFWYESTNKDFRLARQHFDGMEDLKKLVIKSAIEYIQPDLFNSLTSLNNLELIENQITELKPGFIKNQHELRTLILRKNNISNISKEVFRGAESIMHLDLSNNIFEELDVDVFALLQNLTMLDLSYNRFIALPEKMLSENRNLTDFSLRNNLELKTLPDNFLANLPNLQNVHLKRCGLTHLSVSLFHGSSEVVAVDLSQNQLDSLPEMLLRDQRHLRELNLEYNNLEMLPDRLFENTTNLRTLRLSYNNLFMLSANVFSNLRKLTALHLNNNNIHTIDKLTFSRTTILEELFLQYNNLSFHEFSFVRQEIDVGEGESSPFQNLNNLRVLKLRSNSISTILRDWSYNGLKLRELDLRENKISKLSFLDLQFSTGTKVDLSHNRISEIDMGGFESILAREPVDQFSVIVNENPINCNCFILHFVRYLHDNNVYKRFKFIADKLRCSEPEELAHRDVLQLQPSELLCKLDSGPAECTSYVRPDDRFIVVNCSGQGLTTIPPLPQEDGYRFIELHIENNNIKHLPTDNLTGYVDVAQLHACNNSITELQPDNLPAGLRLLDITQNNLVTLKQSALEALKGSKQLKSLKLSDNLWHCDCDSSQLLNFVQQNQRKIVDAAQVACEDGRLFDSLTVNELCDITPYIIVGIVLSIVGILIGLFTVLYYTYQVEIKVWLFTHNLCMWWVSEEELDKDKSYDAFISYSHEEDVFVANDLVPKLEEMCFKTCWHLRDFMPGEEILTQVIRSVEESRRTIIVLSENFLKSHWGQEEFRTAHFKSIEEKRNRVVIILYGDIGDIESLNPEMKAHLKMNTYVKWGDPWFWDKLRYAMPHPPTVKGHKKRGMMNQNLQSTIGDKLDLVKSMPEAPASESTPPAEKTTKMAFTS